MNVMDLEAHPGAQEGCDAFNGPHECLKPSAVRKRFLELSVLVHPDKNPFPSAKEVALLTFCSKKGEARLADGAFKALRRFG